MSYTPYLIANYATGLNDRLQPWLSPDDSQQELFDGYVYRGTLSKREGYNYFATGGQGGQPYTESRIVHELVAVPMVGVINSSNKVFTLAATAQIQRGTFVVTGSTPLQVLTDNGLGGFTGAGTGTINYVTGAVSITFTTAPTGGTVLATYNFMPDDPVMMVASFYTATNIRELIVASTKYVNRYNSTLNILEDISPAAAYTGNSHNFFTWTNYQDADSNPRLIFANNKDVIQQYDGTIPVTDYAYNMTSTVSPFNPVMTLTCLLMTNYKDRLLLFRTTEDGTIYPRRIRISGTGASSDDFRETATGAGLIDIPDNTWIFGIAQNRDDIIIFTQGSTWVLKYTGNDTTPFVLNRIDESRGSEAPFAAITYLNRTSAASTRGLIMTDGYRVERQDEDIPDFSFDEVYGKNFDLCFAGSVDADRDHYLIYPPQGEAESKRILTTNYDEDNYSIYRLPLSCMGTYVTAFDIDWNDLTAANGFPNWDAFGSKYGNWHSFAYSQGAPFSIGGGHHGEIWRLAVTEEEDNPVMIRNISQIDSVTLEITTDWNNYSLNEDDREKGTDFIFFTGISGMLELNDKQYPIVSVTNNNVFRVTVPSDVTFTAYTSGGVATRVIPFSALFKKFNPYANQDRKVRCGWLYMYVDTTDTDLTRNIAIESITNANPAVVTTILNHNLVTGDEVNLFGIGGMTQLNDTGAFVTVLTPTTFTLNGVDSTAFGAYTSGGYAAISENAKMTIDIIVNDVDEPTKLDYNNLDPYQGNCTNMVFQDDSKKWYKVYINQTGKFIQFRLRNKQAGAKINVQATMPGFQPVGRLI